jgi:small subunit ribosomal protein S3
MGHKINPKSLRLNVTRTWDSIWFAGKKNYPKLLFEDIKIREEIEKNLIDARIGKIEILRPAGRITVNINTARPGVIIGQQGSAIETLKLKLEKKFNQKFDLNIIEIKKPGICAKLVAETVKVQIEKRIAFRRAAKSAMEKAFEAGAKGIKIKLAGRLNGVEIARQESFLKGKVPLHTIRADIDYECIAAHTTFGAIGIKVWIYKGEVFKGMDEKIKGDVKEKLEAPISAL